MCNHYYTAYFILMGLCGAIMLSNADQGCTILELFNECKQNETCSLENNVTHGTCVCKPGYMRLEFGGDCLEDPLLIPTTVSPSHHPPVSPTAEPHQAKQSGMSQLMLWLLVPCVVLACLGSLVLAARRYRWMDRLYQMRVRHYDTMLVGTHTGAHRDEAPVA